MRDAGCASTYIWTTIYASGVDADQQGHPAWENTTETRRRKVRRVQRIHLVQGVPSTVADSVSTDMGLTTWHVFMQVLPTRS